MFDLFFCSRLPPPFSFAVNIHRHKFIDPCVCMQQGQCGAGPLKLVLLKFTNPYECSSNLCYRAGSGCGSVGRAVLQTPEVHGSNPVIGKLL